MSLAISLLFALFGFLFSWTGVFTLLCGVLLFVLLPVVSLISGVKKFARVHIYLAMWAIKRGAIVVDEHDGLLFKSMEFDDLGVEKITFGAETKEFEDPATALHHFMGFPFTLADEVHGLLFDPRHAAVGDREHAAEEQNEMYIRATDDEWGAYEVYGWVKGVFEMPKNEHELVDLSQVRQIVTGTERAEYPARIETMYKNSRMPYADKTSMLRIAMPVLSFLAVFGGLWFMASQGTTSSGGGSTVGYSSLLLFGVGVADLRQRLSDMSNRDKLAVLITGSATTLAFASGYLLAGLAFGVLFAVCILGGFTLLVARSPVLFLDTEEDNASDSESDSDATDQSGMESDSFAEIVLAGAREVVETVDWHRLGKVLALVLPVPVLFLLVAAVGGLVTAVLAFVVLGMGFWLVPLLAVFARPSDKLSGAMAKLYLMLGFLGYEKPVFEWTPAKYRLREFEDLEDADAVNWYGLANSLVGFTFAPGMDSWGQEVVSPTELDARKEAVADGGGRTNIPSGYTRYPDMQRSVYAAFVPNRIKRHHYYLHSGITLSRFTNAAIGEKSLRKLLAAKEKYGEDGWGISDSTLMWMTLGAAVIAAVLGVFVFFL